MKLPNYIDHELWQDFINHRREIRHKLTPTATKFMLKKLAKFHANGIDVNECLTRAIENGWQGVFPIHPENAEMNRLYLPKDDDELWAWARQNGFPDPMAHEKYPAYRQRLGHLMRGQT